MSKHKNRKSLREVLRDFFGFLDEDWQADIGTDDTDDEPSFVRDVLERTTYDGNFGRSPNFSFLDEDWQAGIETEDTDDEPNCARDVPEHHI